MKLFVMDTILPPAGSGWTTHKYELTRNLSKLGLEVHAMTYAGIELEGIVTHSIKAKENYKYNFIFKFVHLINILKTIYLYNFDILYTRNVSLGLLGLLAKKMTKSKLVVELNGLVVEDRKVTEKQFSMKYLILIYLEFFIAKKADAIITVAPGIRNILIKHGTNKDKITVIANGANTDLFKPVDTALTISELQTRYNVGKDDNVVIFVGNLMRWHGVECLIECAPTVLKTFPNTKFLIVGDGHIKKELMDMTETMGVANKFIFTGKIPYEYIPAYINISDVCVAPFISARNAILGLSPVKIYEYLACGKPVVASNIRGVGELLENSNSGIPVTPEDPAELANSIIKLFNDEVLREQMGVNGRKLVVSEYSWENTAIKTMGVFKNLLIEGVGNNETI